MPYLLALAGAALSVLAFPPFGAWPLAVIGPALWLSGLARVERSGQGAGVGFVFGLAFFGGLIWWLSELGWEALVPLVVVQAVYPGLFGWVMVRWVRGRSGHRWWMVAAGVWAVLEFVRYRFPVSGFEWGAWGYALSDLQAARAAARWVGTTGLTVLVMAAASGLATLAMRVAAVPVGLLAAALAFGALLPNLPEGEAVPVAIVQGSTPCPFEHCENERFRTYQQHLELTRTIDPGTVDLVVWSEGSTGSVDADPINAPEVGEAISAEAARIDAWMLVGGDRPISETHWINAVVGFAPSGQIVGEYRKQHPVPFGEYIPARPLFEWIPALDQVPRDMIPGEGAVVFDLGGYSVGTVISFEGGFSRYARQMVDAGADLLVVATNEGSYGTTPASDQFIGMTRMRAAETGHDLIHAAVTGKSAIITDGGVVGQTTGLGTMEVLYGEVQPRPGLQTVYVRLGDWLMLLAVVGAAALWIRSHFGGVGSGDV
ncbi:MAG TPA: apolipoprotein N-acyltransferase [Acidimicrobiia bacterium]|nr:apolipoprotein N-acyltransferase [Acidimicrobiia bacterium]